MMKQALVALAVSSLACAADDPAGEPPPDAGVVVSSPDAQVVAEAPDAAPPPAPADAAPTVRKRVFVSEASHHGDLGGPAGADRLCGEAASAAGLGGEWTAWVSTAEVNAIQRVSEGPWYLVDG